MKSPLFIYNIRLSLLFALVFSFACSTATKSDDVSGSQTHWLKSCTASAECGDSLSCHCGVCTTSCTDDSTCSDQSECVATSNVGACEESAPESVCLVTCSSDDDCSSTARCSDNVCTAKDDPTTPAGVRCADYEPCDALSPCADTNCIAFPECGAALCIDASTACELSCPDVNDCTIAESYPEQLFCSGRVPAIPGEPEDDDADNEPPCEVGSCEFYGVCYAEGESTEDGCCFCTEEGGFCDEPGWCPGNSDTNDEPNLSDPIIPADTPPCEVGSCEFAGVCYPDGVETEDGCCICENGVGTCLEGGGCLEGHTPYISSPCSDESECPTGLQCRTLQCFILSDCNPDGSECLQCHTDFSMCTRNCNYGCPSGSECFTEVDNTGATIGNICMSVLLD